jgi:hypothetical protein
MANATLNPMPGLDPGIFIEGSKEMAGSSRP